MIRSITTLHRAGFYYGASRRLTLFCSELVLRAFANQRNQQQGNFANQMEVANSTFANTQAQNQSNFTNLYNVGQQNFANQESQTQQWLALVITRSAISVHVVEPSEVSSA